MRVVPEEQAAALFVGNGAQGQDDRVGSVCSLLASP